MTTAPAITLDLRRYRQLIALLRVSHDALRQAHFFHCGPSDSFRIVQSLAQTLRTEQEHQP